MWRWGANGPLLFYKNKRLFLQKYEIYARKTKGMKILKNDEGLKIVIDAWASGGEDEYV